MFKSRNKISTMTEAYEQFSAVVVDIKEAQQSKSVELQRKIEEAASSKEEADKEVSLADKALNNMRNLFGL